jgi:hypothetical protein
MSTETWELPTSLAAIFPKTEGDQLKNEKNYYIWPVGMRNAFESCEMMGIVDSSETCPPDDTTHMAKHCIWKKKDNLAKAMIMQCVKANLIIKVTHAKHAKESWDMFASKYSQTGSGLIMVQATDQATLLWWQYLHMLLASRKLSTTGYIAAAILLSTLPSDPGDPHFWNQHVAGIKINKKSTTLSSVINGILEEKQ